MKVKPGQTFSSVGLLNLENLLEQNCKANFSGLPIDGGWAWTLNFV
jgi:hypothetical protein